ncbi:MAG: hypothetical protein LH618_08390, partial [Saprospiraceae bacterium]|nr:hypothetical protein [Saprospiraceae bacterium]
MEEDLYIRIEDYLDGALNAAERTALEADLQADPLLAETLAQVREARARLIQHWAHEEDERALSGTLQQLGRAHFTRNSASLAAINT